MKVENNAITALLIVILVMTAGHVSAQTFGQFTTASISPLGEGGVFMTAGDGQFRGGVTSRFEFMSRSDLGIQLGYDRAESIDSYGGGIDYKFSILDEGSTALVLLAADVSYGFLAGGGFSRSILGISVLISGKIDADIPAGIEPYGSIGFFGTLFHGKGGCGEERPGSWPCESDDSSTVSDMVLRGGAKILLTDQYHLLCEIKYDDTASFGIMMNIVF
jgi:hypothetical protein